MPTWHVDFTKEFSILVSSPTREAALLAAMESIESRDIDYHWETGEWEAHVWPRPELHAPDHGIKGGVIVNIEDAEDV
jgi:hypothetical protein